MPRNAVGHRLPIPGRAELSALAPDFVVIRTHAGPMAWPVEGISECTAFDLDARYESSALLVYCRVQDLGASTQVLQQLAASGLGPHQLHDSWQAVQLPHPNVCQALKATSGGGERFAITQIATVKEDLVVLARLFWSGFPLLNWWFVDFKPGMRARVQELLQAGLDLLQPSDHLQVSTP